MKHDIVHLNTVYQFEDNVTRTTTLTDRQTGWINKKDGLLCTRAINRIYTIFNRKHALVHVNDVR